MDKKQIQEKLRQLRSQTSKTRAFWRPESGNTVIRILPYKYSEDNQDHYPFLEMWFHYDLGLKVAPVSLKTFGKPDPIIEMAEQLIREDDKNSYAMGKKLQPKMRVFAPVLVRGKENEGPKIWQFGKEVYMALLELINDPEYDKIWDIKKGTDITVIFKTAKEAGRNFPETKIQPKRGITPISSDDKVLKTLASMPNVHELYQDRTYDYDGLKDILDRWLKGEDEKEPGETASSEKETGTEEIIEEGMETGQSQVEDAEKEFETLFGSK